MIHTAHGDCAGFIVMVRYETLYLLFRKLDIELFLFPGKVENTAIFPAVVGSSGPGFAIGWDYRQLYTLVIASGIARRVVFCFHKFLDTQL